MISHLVENLCKTHGTVSCFLKNRVILASAMVHMLSFVPPCLMLFVTVSICYYVNYKKICRFIDIFYIFTMGAKGDFTQRVLCQG